MDDILEILVPLGMFAAFYFFARIQKYIKEAGERAKMQGGSSIDAEERMRRRLEALAAKQDESVRKTGTVRQAARQQRREAPQRVVPARQQPSWQSEEEMMEKLGIAEFERREALGEIPAAIHTEHVSAAPRYTAAHHAHTARITGAMTLRQMVLAKEIFDRPVAMRPPRNPFGR